MDIKELNKDILAEVNALRDANAMEVFNLVKPMKASSTTASTGTSKSTGTRGSRSSNGQAILEVLETEGRAMKGSEITEQLTAKGIEITSKQVSDLLWALAGGVSDSDHSVGAEYARTHAPIEKVSKGVYQWKGGK